jgi:hypothetical protein
MKKSRDQCRQKTAARTDQISIVGRINKETEELRAQNECGDYWVLHCPGTEDDVLIKLLPGKDWYLLTFVSEADALEFKSLHAGLPPDAVPKFIPKVH